MYRVQFIAVLRSPCLFSHDIGVDTTNDTSLVRVLVLKSGSNMSHDSAADLFRQVVKQFRDSLSPHDSAEFTEFNSAEIMLKELKLRVMTYQKKTRFVSFCQRLESVSESLSPFFDIVGIFIQSNPEIPAL